MKERCGALLLGLTKSIYYIQIKANADFPIKRQHIIHLNTLDDNLTLMSGSWEKRPNLVEMAP